MPPRPAPSRTHPRQANGAETGAVTARPIVGTLLPANLADALRHLSDRDFDTLLRGVTEECQRRGKESPSLPAEPRKVAEPAKVVSGLTSGQTNAVRAALQAGVKPSAFARQFALPLSVIRQLETRRPTGGKR